MVSKSNEQKIVNANKKRWLSKKEILIIALAITAIIAGIITIIITLNVFTSDSKKDEPTLEETLKSKADFSTYAHYRAVYEGAVTTIQVATVKENPDGTWKVAGKVQIKDDYGDTYTANWHIIYRVEEDGEIFQTDHNFSVPTKSS